MINLHSPLKFSNLRMIDFFLGFLLPFLFFGFCGAATIYPFDHNYLIAALAGIATYCFMLLTVIIVSLFFDKLYEVKND